jgi:hypothetical protein
MMSGEKHCKPYNMLKGKSKVHVYLALVYTYPGGGGYGSSSPNLFENIECTIWHLEAHAQYVLTTTLGFMYYWYTRLGHFKSLE